MKYLQEVKDWWVVGNWLLGYGSTKQLNAIHMKYRSNEDRLKAVVQRWLQAGGIPRSWKVASLVTRLGRGECSGRSHSWICRATTR